MKSACCCFCYYKFLYGEKGLKEKQANYWKLMLSSFRKGFIMIHQLKCASVIITFLSEEVASGLEEVWVEGKKFRALSLNTICEFLFILSRGKEKVSSTLDSSIKREHTKFSSLILRKVIKFNWIITESQRMCENLMKINFRCVIAFLWSTF